MVKKVISTKKLSIPEVYEYLKHRVDTAEPTYFQHIALEHAEIVKRTDGKTARKIIEMLVEEFRISDEGAIAIVNYLPNTIDELRAILGAEARASAGTAFTTEVLEQILNRISDILVENDSEDN